MSWRFPKYPLNKAAGGVHRVDDLNENLLPFAEEGSGKLNEHNWKNGAITSLTDLADDVAFQWHSRQLYEQSSRLDAGNVEGGDQFKLEDQIQWTLITGSSTDGSEDMSLTFTSPSCLLWIHASYQLQAHANTGVRAGGCQLALRVDNVVIPETIVGTPEIQNDPTGYLAYGDWPGGLQTVQPVAEGSHTVELVIRGSQDWPQTSAVPVYVESRELVILEMRR